MKTTIIIAILFFLCSCSKTIENKEPGVIEETKQILNDYPDTLESSIKNAKKVTEQYNQNEKELEKNINAIKSN